jgi:hypothetical protein
MPGIPTFERFTTVERMRFPFLIRIGSNPKTKVNDLIELVAVLASYEQSSAIMLPTTHQNEQYQYCYTSMMFDRYQPDRRVRVEFWLDRIMGAFPLEMLVEDCWHLDHQARIRACSIFAARFLADSSRYRA